MRRDRPFLIPLLLLAAAPLAADDVRGAERMLCATTSVTACLEGEDCYKVNPSELNLPDFIEVDLKARRLKATLASGQNRSTEIKNLHREGGTVILQGFENGRAFSFLIDELLGTASIAVAREGIAIAGFAACTPMLAGEPRKP
jgi:hypothetical protein